jgi:hypothetical protein
MDVDLFNPAASNKQSDLPMLSRRDLMRSGGLLFPILFKRGVANDSAASTDIQVTLAHEFAQAGLCCVSADGTKLCLEEWKASGAPVKVVEAGTWQTIYSDRFQQRNIGASFFADSRALLLEFVGPRGQAREIIVDISTGKRTERLRPYDPFRYSEQAVALDDRVLALAHFGLEPRRLQWLARVEFSDYRELSRNAIPLE